MGQQSRIDQNPRGHENFDRTEPAAQLSGLSPTLRAATASPDINELLSFELDGQDFVVGVYPREPGPRPEGSTSSDWLHVDFDQKLVIYCPDSPEGGMIETGIELGYYISDSMFAGTREWRTASCSIVAQTAGAVRIQVEVQVTGDYWSNERPDCDWRHGDPKTQTVVLEFTKSGEGSCSVKELDSTQRNPN